MLLENPLVMLVCNVKGRRGCKLLTSVLNVSSTHLSCKLLHFCKKSKMRHIILLYIYFLATFKQSDEYK